jgi:hypothetical protein
MTDQNANSTAKDKFSNAQALDSNFIGVEREGGEGVGGGERERE